MLLWGTLVRSQVQNLATKLLARNLAVLWRPVSFPGTAVSIDKRSSGGSAESSQRASLRVSRVLRGEQSARADFT